MRKILIAIVSVGFLVFTSCEDELRINQIDNEISEVKTLKNSQNNKVLNFRAPLNGMNEVPAVVTDASGLAKFQLSKDGAELSYKIVVEDIMDVLMAHLHMAPEGTNGPVVAWLYPSGPPPVLIPGLFSGVLAEGVITDSDLKGPLAGMTLEDLVEDFYEGLIYVNVHTTTYPGGEIRGQVKGNMPNGKPE